MPTDHRTKLATIKHFDQLIAYLHDEMGWPIAVDSFDDVDDLFYDFSAEELGIDAKNAAKIQEIKRLRPLSIYQPWGIFFVKFEPKRLPVVALRRILSQVALKKRASANSAERAAWSANDLLFVSNYGEDDTRQISFAHFSQNEAKKDLPTLKVLGWNNLNTLLHLDDVAEHLTRCLAWPDDEEDAEKWRKQWRSAFTLVHREVITTSKKLSVELAKLARNIRYRINSILDIETEDGPVTKLMGAFKEALIHDLDGDSFADMYAQTITYGLLSARVANPKSDTSDDFAAAMPVTNPFLKELMETFLAMGGRKGKAGQGTGLDFDELGVSEVVELLDASNMEAVVLDFGDRNPQEDPVIHFYELFLKEYDAKKRMQRGVFYTPRPVVSYIVRSVDALLRMEFGLEDGLADTTTWGEMAKRHKDLKIPKGISPDEGFIQILDPATGTGTFLVEVIDVIYRTMKEKWRREAGGPLFGDIQKRWNEYVPKHLLPRLHGYELMMAPYAIAHMKIGLKLYETGYRFGSDKRARVYLTNSLEPPQDFSGTLAFAIPALAHEAEEVNTIKRDQRFTVVIGNPPYSGESANPSEFPDGTPTFIGRLVRDYFFVDGQPLGERNSKWLHDDYAKFFRFAEYVIESSCYGILGYITNHSFIFNPTFRGMRQHLLKCFTRLEALNLHGSMKLREHTPEGTLDENVFDIEPGTAITLGARTFEADNIARYGNLWGTRVSKYERLALAEPISLTDQQYQPAPPFYLLFPQGELLRDEFQGLLSLKEIMPLSNTGIITKRDSLTIHFSTEGVWHTVNQFVSCPVAEAYQKFGLPDDVRDWSVERAQADLRSTGLTKKRISRICYRPFDIRFSYYTGNSRGFVGWPVDKIYRQMVAGPNLAFCIGRAGQAIDQGEWNIVFCTRHMTEFNLFRRGGNVVFPLYVYDEGYLSNQNGLSQVSVSVNLSKNVMRKLPADGTMADYEPERLFGFIYALLYSPGYRLRYAEFLKIDYPRIPLPNTLNFFRKLARLGSELVALHLMESPKLNNHITTLIGSGDFQVEKVSYSDEIVWIDKAKTHGFRGVPEEVWNFHIGGYQVCEKWLKDRGPKKGNPGRTLLAEDIDHYQKIVVALSETIRIMGEIDEVIEAHGGWPGAFQTDAAPSKQP